MDMLALALLAAATQAVVAPTTARPLPAVSARSQVVVRIVRAAEVRSGRSSEPHQRRLRRDPDGMPQILLEFE